MDMFRSPVIPSISGSTSSKACRRDRMQKAANRRRGDCVLVHLAGARPRFASLVWRRNIYPLPSPSPQTIMRVAHTNRTGAGAIKTSISMHLLFKISLCAKQVGAHANTQRGVGLSMLPRHTYFPFVRYIVVMHMPYGTAYVCVRMRRDLWSEICVHKVLRCLCACADTFPPHWEPLFRIHKHANTKCPLYGACNSCTCIVCSWRVPWAPIAAATGHTRAAWTERGADVTRTTRAR